MLEFLWLFRETWFAGLSDGLSILVTVQIDAYLIANPGRIQAAINFNISNAQAVSYSIQTNSTCVIMGCSTLQNADAA